MTDKSGRISIQVRLNPSPKKKKTLDVYNIYGFGCHKHLWKNPGFMIRFGPIKMKSAIILMCGCCVFVSDVHHYMCGKFHFVDLAGSERAHRTGNMGDRFKGV